MKAHPIAEVYPMLAGPAFDELVESIRTRGQLHPIYLLDGFILDGRCRFEACKKAKVEPITKEYRGKKDTASLIEFVDAMNDKRRHLSISQRAVAAFKLKKYAEAEGADSANLPTSNSSVAKQLRVSTRSVGTAGKVVENAAPEVVKAVERGDFTVNDASAVAELPKELQAKAVKKASREGITLKQAATDFNPKKLDAQSKKTSGKETVKPVDRKEALAAFGKLVRLLDKMKISANVDGELKTILQAIKAS